MKRCMYCGHENDDSAVTCEKCGNQLLDMPSDQGEMPLEELPDEVVAEEMPETAVPNIEIEEEAGEAVAEPELTLDMPEEAVPSAPVENQSYTAAAEEADFGATQNDYAPEQEAPAYSGQAYGYEENAQAQQPYTGQEYGYEEQVPQQEYTEAVQQEPYRRQSEIQEEMSDAADLMRRARRRVKSPLFFLAALVYTLMTGAAIANIVLGNARENVFTVGNTLSNAIGNSLITEYLNRLMNAVAGVDPLVLVLVALVAQIPGILMMIGLWMMFGGVSNRKEEISTGGFTMVKAVEILRFVVACIVLLAAIIMSVAFVVANGASSATMSLIVWIIVLLIVVIIAVFTIMYYVQMLYSIKTVKRNCRSGEYTGRIPGFVVFIVFLGCLLTAASMIPMAPDDYVGLAYKGLSALWQLLIVLWATVYRAKVR